MIARKSTGIPNLDRLIQGGIKERSITLVEGDAGSGKSTLAIHFIMAGISAGENGIYMSVEESKDSFFENMELFGFKLDEYEKAGKLLFYECTPKTLKDFLDRGFIDLEDKVVRMQAKRLVVDSITAFIMLHGTDPEQRMAVQHLFEKIRSWGITTIVTAESTHTQPHNWASYLVDGWIRLYNKKTGRERVRSIEVLKMRGTRHDTTEIVYRIENKGLNLYPNERIFAGED